MRLLIILLIAVIITACSQQVELEEKKINMVAIEAIELLEATPEPRFEFDYSDKSAIKSLNPKSVYITNEGIYIVLDSGFTSESGLFVSRKGVVVNTDTGQDPLYKLLRKNIYQYEIKG